MSKLANKLNLSQIGRVCVTVEDTDRAIEFYDAAVAPIKRLVLDDEVGDWKREATEGGFRASLL
jgi:hypothetical protein